MSNCYCHPGRAGGSPHPLGLRWDINPAPGNLIGPPPYNLNQITDLATAQIAPTGTPLWKTDWHGFAPRLGVAYQVHQASGYETVLRTGFGLFYDMGNTQGSEGFRGVGFSTYEAYFGAPFPLTSAQVYLPPPSITPPYNEEVFAIDPNLKLPYTMQWNVAVEQGLGARQTLTMNYLGSTGSELLKQFEYIPPTGAFAAGGLDITSNGASSVYNALQVKYQENLSHGLQALASYTWAHAIDDASSNFQLPELLRASSDFDIRQNLQAAVTYDIPGAYSNPMESALLSHWGLDTRISARSALPLDIIGSTTVNPSTQQYENFHPNLIPGQPIYVHSLQSCAATATITNPAAAPGGRLLNLCAFLPALAGVDGNSGRNSVRGFDAVQADLALRRNFRISERLHMQFRAEAFNVLNHAIFGSIYNNITYGPSQFGYAYSTLNSSLGGLSSLYQTGGPRSLQISLKLQF